MQNRLLIRLAFAGKPRWLNARMSELITIRNLVIFLCIFE